MRWLLRLLAALAAFLFVLRPLWRWLSSRQQRAAEATPPPGGVLKRDPVCGTFVDAGLAVKETAAGAMLHFCSERCRAEWRARQSAAPAAGAPGAS